MRKIDDENLKNSDSKAKFGNENLANSNGTAKFNSENFANSNTITANLNNRNLDKKSANFNSQAKLG